MLQDVADGLQNGQLTAFPLVQQFFQAVGTHQKDSFLVGVIDVHAGLSTFREAAAACWPESTRFVDRDSIVKATVSFPEGQIDITMTSPPFSQSVAAGPFRIS
jgi:hypothetical protein